MILQRRGRPEVNLSSMATLFFPSALCLVKESASDWVLLAVGRLDIKVGVRPCYFFIIDECSAATERVYSLSFSFVVQFSLILSKKLYEQDSY